MNSQKKMPVKSARKSSYDENFKPLNAEPEAVARKILLTPPKRLKDWKYMKAKSARKAS
ncbi:MAG: hypothetical protein OXI87_23580 [Albidovulum sp.]|nr:hypothetical protein [Albidovulum sp.]